MCGNSTISDERQFGIATLIGNILVDFSSTFQHIRISAIITNNHCHSRGHHDHYSGRESYDVNDVYRREWHCTIYSLTPSGRVSRDGHSL